MHEIDVATWIEEYLPYKQCADEYEVRLRWDLETALWDHYMVHEWASVVLFGTSYWERHDLMFESERCYEEDIEVLGVKMDSFAYAVWKGMELDNNGDPASALDPTEMEEDACSKWARVLEWEFQLPSEFTGGDCYVNRRLTRAWGARYTVGENREAYSEDQIWLRDFGFESEGSLRWYAGCSASFREEYAKVCL
jgi:hypothetical protein